MLKLEEDIFYCFDFLKFMLFYLLRFYYIIKCFDFIFLILIKCNYSKCNILNLFF